MRHAPLLAGAPVTKAGAPKDSRRRPATWPAVFVYNAGMTPREHGAKCGATTACTWRVMPGLDKAGAVEWLRGFLSTYPPSRSPSARCASWASTALGSIRSHAS